MNLQEENERLQGVCEAHRLCEPNLMALNQLKEKFASVAQVINFHLHGKIMMRKFLSSNFRTLKLKCLHACCPW